MTEALTRPFILAWRSLVEWHRTRLDDDPDVIRVREKRKDAERTLNRVNIVEREYLRGKRP